MSLTICPSTLSPACGLARIPTVLLEQRHVSPPTTSCVVISVVSNSKVTAALESSSVLVPRLDLTYSGNATHREVEEECDGKD